MPDIKPPQSVSDLPLAIIDNMIILATSGFGLVVALAWNQLIQNAITLYLNPYLGQSGGIISLLIYALVITILAVVVTMQLATVQRRVEMTSKRREEQRLARLKSK